MRVRWSAVALILGIVALGAVGTLTAIVSTKDVDTLATVALALAVVSFAAQLVVTLSQAQQSAQVNGETKAALAEMRATTDSLLSNQSDQYDMLLKALLGKTTTVVEDAVAEVAADHDATDSSRDEQVSQLEDALEVHLKKAIVEAAAGVDPERGKTGGALTWDEVNSEVLARRNRERRSRAARLLEWEDRIGTLPSQADGEPIAETLRTLPPQALSTLSGPIASAARMTAASGQKYITIVSDPTSGTLQMLENAGLITSLQPLREHSPAEMEFRLRLTPTGLTALQILLAKGDPPSWAAGLPRRPA